ncbi:hypothetical protein M378DRAFT_14230 [Amanita muscaria Koide BX008]|uniref:ERCC4 domain-containing protein n=1 Tax=Amanita muscaria (strain Koide BX008) TaxID=946122 RepID=A0A0C2WUC4_AMAMK|nr:hypothetical protein M378DRAFT_14230 [Amanita muscaria Koide BX008]
MSTLLPFHKKILEDIHDPATSELLVMARGLGMRRVICTLMKIYDSPKNLVLLVNATQEEERNIVEELSILGCHNPGLRVIGYETGSKDRQALYNGGGLVSVTSRILVVDMLQSDIPTELITGIIVLHAERVTPTALEAFIVRLYREKNKSGFLKAFTDQPESITSGLSPLRNIMKELQLRKVHMYPRFHEDVKKSLERRRADVVELAQEMTESMADIHHAIIQCMNATLSELKKSNTASDLDELNVENAYFRSFDIIVRRKLDPVWHKVGPKTKQLVNDLSTLRQLLFYLVTYDPIQYHAYLETIIAANSTTPSGGARQHQSPWLLTDAANIIFKYAKRRCYLTTTPHEAAPALDPSNDSDAWEALDELQGVSSAKDNTDMRPPWLPSGMEPVLEELPKWELLGEILLEIEGEIIRQQLAQKSTTSSNPGSDAILIVTSSTRSCQSLREYLSMMDHDAPRGAKGRPMLMRRFRNYLFWKKALSHQRMEAKAQAGPQASKTTSGASGAHGLSAALKRKDKLVLDKANGRRRMRGGAAAAPTRGAEKSKSGHIQDDDEETERIASLFPLGIDKSVSLHGIIDITDDNEVIDMDILLSEDTSYGLLAAEETVVISAYSDDTDDRMLAELQPKFIVMFEPCMEFARRVEVYRSTHPGLGVRVYHMVYRDSCEEHKYLAAIRKEKESFERLIRERGTMLMPILEEQRADTRSDVIKTISSRIAGGRRELNTEPSRVIVDMREFRSALPSLLHAAYIKVVPATLTVGDYVLAPDMCVERKSLPDLVSSFTSGRLYTQCELMLVHYKHPILLIEFEEDKAFNLDLLSEVKSYVKPTGKYPVKTKGPSVVEPDPTFSIQSKLALLTLAFPRLRIIWSSSPYASVQIFNDLKHNNPEPDTKKAIATGAGDDPEVGAGVNAQAEELLRCLPGINDKNIKYVMNRVKTVKELCDMSSAQVQGMLGVEPGKACYEFMHRGERKY